jgi:outer membrane protein
MGLSDALAEVLRSNLRLRSQALEKTIAKEQLRGEWAIFEPDFVASVTEEANNRQNTRQQFLSQATTIFDEKNRIYSSGIEGLLPTGGRLKVSGQNRRLDNNLQLAGQRESESFVAVSLTQPLLKGAGWGVTAAQIKLASAQSRVVMQEYRRQLMLVLSQSELAYWDLVAARDLANLRASSAEMAERVLTDNKARVEQGKMTEIEVLQAESGVAVRKAGVSDARQRVDAALSQLNSFFGRTLGGGLEPAEKLEPKPVDNDRSRALMLAFRNHPLYIAQLEKSRQDDIRLSYAKNQKWPQLDLKASYGLNGLGSDFDNSVSFATSSDYPSWYVGFELRIPLGGGQKARSQTRVATSRKEQGLLEIKAIEVELINSVSTTLAKASSADEKSKSFRGVVALNQRLLDTELSRLDGGKSDSRKVLQAEQDLADARVSELEARLDWQRANVELLVQTGTYLEQHGFEVQ